MLDRACKDERKNGWCRCVRHENGDVDLDRSLGGYISGQGSWSRWNRGQHAVVEIDRIESVVAMAAGNKVSYIFTRVSENNTAAVFRP